MKKKYPFFNSLEVFNNVIFLLIIGLFSIKLYFSSPIFWIFSILTIVFVYYRSFKLKKDPFGFFLIFFFVSHFSYVENQGGLWNISVFLFYIFLILINVNELKYFKTDRISYWALIILFLSNMIGWIFNSDAEIVERIQGFVMLSSYILTFILVSNFKITPFVIKRFFNTLTLITIYLFFVAINQTFGIINTTLPFFPPKDSFRGIIYLSSNSDSTFGNSELYGEYSALIFLITMSVARSKVSVRAFFSNSYYPAIIIILSFLGAFLSGSRASVILVIIATFVMLIKALFNFKIYNNYLKIFFRFSVVAVFLFFLNFDLGFNTTQNDFSSVDKESISLKDIISGESINRFKIFEYAKQRLNSESLIIGKGLGPLESNILAWWGYVENVPYVDYHNLYYSLPFLYGYLGMFCFLFLIFRIMTLNTILNFKKNNLSYLNPILSVMPYFWVFFLIDEWKISMLRNSNYHMIIWIFLALNYAIIKTNKIKK